MTEQNPENFSQFEKLLADVARTEVDFAVVGGGAASLNGFVRGRFSTLMAPSLRHPRILVWENNRMFVILRA